MKSLSVRNPWRGRDSAWRQSAIVVAVTLFGAASLLAAPSKQASSEQHGEQARGRAPETAPGTLHRPLAPSEQPSPEELKALEAAEASAAATEPGAKVIKIAKNELGHHEGTGNCTKYGAWFGDHCAEWCDMFISWVFHEAGYLEAIGGKHYNVDDHIAWFKKHKRFHDKPCLGCILFLDTNHNGEPNHVGIVRSFTSTRVHTIEGNASDKVSAVKYARSDRRILGYGDPDWTACPSGSVYTTCHCGSHSSGCRPHNMSPANFCGC